MKYVIMSGGKGTRWNNYMGITKQEINIDGESLLQRTCRLIRQNCTDEIIISTSNNNHHVDGYASLKPRHDTYFKSKYVYELLTTETTFLYGDTFYTEETIKTIVETNTKSILFFGDASALIGVKISDYILFKNIIDNIDESESLYSQVKQKLNIGNDECFKSVGSSFYNINSPIDYENLKYFSSHLLNNIFISILVIFSNESSDDVLNNLENIYTVKKIEIDENLNNILTKKLKEQLQIYKHQFDSSDLSIFTIEIDDPLFNKTKDLNSIACEQVKELKNKLSNEISSGSIYISDTVIDSAKIKTLIDKQILQK